MNVRPIGWLTVSMLVGTAASAWPQAAPTGGRAAISQARPAAGALETANPFLGGVPDPLASPQPLSLSLTDAMQRGLQHNLGVLLQEQNVQSARGSRWRDLSEMLPEVSGRLAETRQVINLAAFGFTSFPGVPLIVGPFNVFDARLYLSQPVVDLTALYNVKAGAASLRAEQQSLKNARDLVVLVTANLYLQVITAQSRIEATRAQRETAEALYRTAVDLKAAGMTPGIDVLRAQVQVQTQRQRVSAAENDFQKQKLQLARAIGLALGQVFDLTDKIPYAALPPIPLDEALRRAYESRADYLAAQAALQSAEARHRSAWSEHLPSLQVNADYGAIGSTVDDSHGTYSIGAAVRVPVFDADRQRARLLETDAALQRRRIEAADFKARIDYEVRAAFFDLTSADEQLQASQSAVELANQELTQARDRFQAGVTNNIEVVQAQESVATATDSYITTLYAHNLAKAALARALGVAEESARTFLGGS